MGLGLALSSNGLIGMSFSLFVVAIAALNLVLDFDFIEQGSENGLPKHMEWFGAFSFDGYTSLALFGDIKAFS